MERAQTHEGAGQSSPKPARVCLLIGTFYPFVGGGETHARLLSAELKRQGTPIFVITRRTSSDLPKRDTVDGVEVLRVPPGGGQRWGKYLMMLPALLKLIRTRRDYDIILVSGIRSLGIPAVLVCRLFGKRCIMRIASCGELSGGFIWDSPSKPEKGAKKSRLLEILVKARNRILLKADGFLAISSAIAEEYRSCGIGEEKITTINNGTDTDRFRPADAEARAALRKQLELPGGTVFAYSGKLNRGKGLEFLVGIWQHVAREHKDAHLLLIGSGKNNFLSCEQELRDKVAAAGIESSVTFTGFVQNVEDYLRAANVFVFPSEDESLSNALIEALACGLPCLASNVGGIPDTVRDQENGRLLPLRDEEAWRGALASALTDPEQIRRWGDAGRQQVLERNSIRSVASRHAALFQATWDA